MTFKNKMKRWALRTIFLGGPPYDGYGDNIELELEKQINVNVPGWGNDRIMSFSVGKMDNQWWFSGNLWSGGFFEYNITTDELEAHN